jgi:mono/diheme cytochrome c family protein
MAAMRAEWIQAAMTIAVVLGGGRALAQSAAPGNGAAPSAKGDTTFAAEVLALGERIFLGKAAGGLCFTCHGTNAKGMKGLGPNLTDAKWLHGDGSYDFIVHAVETGIAKPKEGATPMPPKGGAPLTPTEIRAVAAYVYSLRRKAEGGR